MSLKKMISKTNSVLLVPSHSEIIGNILAQVEVIYLSFSSSWFLLSVNVLTRVPITGCLFGLMLNNFTTKRTS